MLVESLWSWSEDWLLRQLLLWSERKPVLIQHISPSLKAPVFLKLAAHMPTSVPFLLKLKEVWNIIFLNTCIHGAVWLFLPEMIYTSLSLHPEPEQKCIKNQLSRNNLFWKKKFSSFLTAELENFCWKSANERSKVIYTLLTKNFKCLSTIFFFISIHSFK